MDNIGVFFCFGEYLDIECDVVQNDYENELFLVQYILDEGGMMFVYSNVVGGL